MLCIPLYRYSSQQGRGLTACLHFALVTVLSNAMQKPEDATIRQLEVLEVSCGCSFDNAGLQEGNPSSWNASHLEELKIGPFAP